MSRKTGNAQSRATFFRHSAVLSLPAVLLRKLPIEGVTTAPSEYNGVHEEIMLCQHILQRGDITRWREDMNFVFEWQNNILRRYKTV